MTTQLETLVKTVQKSNPETKNVKTSEEKEYKYKLEISWINVFIVTFLHLHWIYSIIYWSMYGTWKIFFWGYGCGIIIAFGVTAGAHRLFSHKSYKATLPLRILLLTLHNASGQTSMYIWARNHRVHHKFSETNADPHNPNRGFFFSHIGWVLCKKHRDVTVKGQTVDFSDLTGDPYVMFQHKYYWYLFPLTSIILPAGIPCYFWGESLWMSWNVAVVFRLLITLHYGLMVNSVAHRYGTKPYDKTIGPVENFFVSLVTNGEGHHNFHHCFPWDYRSTELGSKLNLTKFFIDFMAKIGWAYDMKTAPDDMVAKRIKRTGDGSRITNLKIDSYDNRDVNDTLWGWGDKDMNANDLKNVKYVN